MNDDYLWDKSGETDNEVAQLEDLFQELRFDQNIVTPPPFKRSIATVREPISKKFSFPLKIAAGLVLLLLAGALVLKLGRWPLSPGPTLSTGTASVREVVPAPPDSMKGSPSDIERDTVPGITPVHYANPTTAKRNLQRRGGGKSSNIRTGKIREGERAKAELMAAFRIASEKLNQVQQKLVVNKDVRPSS